MCQIFRFAKQIMKRCSTVFLEESINRSWDWESSKETA